MRLLRLLVPVQLYSKASVLLLEWLTTELAGCITELHLIHVICTPAPLSARHVDQVHKRLLQKFQPLLWDKDVSCFYHIHTVIMGCFTYEDPAASKAASICAAARNLRCSAMIIPSASVKWRDNLFTSFLLGNSLAHHLQQCSSVPVCCKGQELPVSSYSLDVTQKVVTIACSPAGEQHIARACIA